MVSVIVSWAVTVPPIVSCTIPIGLGDKDAVSVAPLLVDTE